MSALFLPELSCGFPSPAGDVLHNRPSLDDAFHLQNPSVFLFKASGNSMAPFILPGDIIIIDRAKKPANGAIVLAICFANFTLKRFHQQNGSVKLVSENQTYSPIEVTEEMNFEIWGVVTGLVRQP